MTLRDVVDYFVIVESLYTAEGNLKPLFFLQKVKPRVPFSHFSPKFQKFYRSFSAPFLGLQKNYSRDCPR
jgi:hypothetical protein